MRTQIILLLFSLPFQIALSQDIRIGGWHSYLNYTEGIKSEEVKDRIYCATRHGLFYIDKSELSIAKLSKIDGFADVEISTIRYDKQNDVLLIAYTNSNIDMLKGNTIYNIPDIYRSTNILGKKTINDIYFYDSKAYISCSFGIVVYDLQKMEVKETLSEIGTGGNQVEVFSVTINNGFIYASTANGIIKANSTGTNLLDYTSWTQTWSVSSSRLVSFNNKVYAASNGIIISYDGISWSHYIDTVTSEFNSLEVYNDKLVVSYINELFIIDKNGQKIIRHKNNRAHALLDENGIVWLSVSFYGIIRDDGANYIYLQPNCPSTNKSWALEFFDNKLYCVPGELTDLWGKKYTGGALYILDKQKWTNRTVINEPAFTNFPDVITLAGNPANKHIFLGSFGKGIAEVADGIVIDSFNQKNSSLRANSGSSDKSNVQVSSIVFDSKGNMWVSNWAAVKPLSVRWANDTTWKSYDIGSASNQNVGQIIIDNNNQKWILLPAAGGGQGLIVFDETRNQGQTYRNLVKGVGNGNLPDNSVNCIAKDLDGKIWIGTNTGVAVFYDPSLIFTNSNSDAQQIWVNEGSNSGYLLATEVITAIAVDGSNNKWIGTKKGLWYVSQDGSKILNQFDVENSPLPSDYIRDIAIDGESGEVFFATNSGIVSFRGNATAGDESFGHVYAFPNPVRPGYNGVIAIKGLVRDADVKITDVSGNLVYATKSEGGQAIWDGNNFDGHPARTGVYLVYCTNTDGSETKVTKIMVIR